MLDFFKQNKSLISLTYQLKTDEVGQKAANLSYLKRLGFNIPDGWVLLSPNETEKAITSLQPSSENHLIVRSSVIGEDSENASAAGQYVSIADIVNKNQLKEAIFDCFNAYNRNNALKYRQDFQQAEVGMAVLIQNQVQGVFSGVAFSRDPVNLGHNRVIIEVLPGQASSVVSGQETPQRYEVEVAENCQIIALNDKNYDIPNDLIKKVAQTVREIERLYQGIPQDMEWSYDGKVLWLLQTRPITNLYPIWTRKIASEVIPGVIRPLTWSINRPVTCSVWGDLFTLVLGKRSQGLNFEDTATLHYQHAYFNASLLGEIFLRMGLPRESLEFLTRGEKFSKPPLTATLVNLKGLFGLLQRELNLEKDFEQDFQNNFNPILKHFQYISLDTLSVEELNQNIDKILQVLPKITYYSILAPLSFALRQNMLKINPEELDNSHTPEIESMRSLAELAQKEGKLIPLEGFKTQDSDDLFNYLENEIEGKEILNKFNQWLDKYGYLGEVGTDIAVPRWRDNPHPVRVLFSQFLFNPDLTASILKNTPILTSNKLKSLQNRLNLKGKVTEVYSRFLAHLRWCFIALGQKWSQQGYLNDENEIFFLELSEIKEIINGNLQLLENDLIKSRQQSYEEHLNLKTVPRILYGNVHNWQENVDNLWENVRNEALNQIKKENTRFLQGIGASKGIKEGIIKICLDLSTIHEICDNNIIVVPYTDSGWTPLLAKAGGIISEVGGILSHGAIIAREYRIPAIMDVSHATQRFQDGQQVRINGQTGIIEIL